MQFGVSISNFELWMLQQKNLIIYLTLIQLEIKNNLKIVTSNDATKDELNYGNVGKAWTDATKKMHT